MGRKEILLHSLTGLVTKVHSQVSKGRNGVLEFIQHDFWNIELLALYVDGASEHFFFLHFKSRTKSERCTKLEMSGYLIQRVAVYPKRYWVRTNRAQSHIKHEHIFKNIISLS